MSKSKKTTKKQGKKSNTDLLENPQGIVESLSKSEHFIRRNRYILIGALAIIVISVVGYLVYSNMQNQQEKLAQKDIFATEVYLPMDSLNLALKGDGNYPGSEDVAKKYPLSKTAKLATFYSGVSYLKDGKFKKAINNLKKVSTSDLLLQARVYSLIGDANLELYSKSKNKSKKNLTESIAFYKKATEYKPNKFFTPDYYMKLALAYELNENYDKALNAYDVVINKYYQHSSANNAKKYKAKLEASTKK